MADHTRARILVASNRGPVSFSSAPDGSLTLKRGGGGLVSGLSAIEDPNTVWVCAALGEADREAARRSPQGRLDQGGFDVGGQAVRMLDIDPEVFDRAYNGVANSTLWFLHHLLYDTPTAPVFDATAAEQWSAFEAYNRAFAEALAAEAAPGAAVLVQDYHLTLVPALLRELRPDLRIGYFLHIPWAPVDYFGLLPDALAAAVLTGVLGADRAASTPGAGPRPSPTAASGCWTRRSTGPSSRSATRAAPPGSACTRWAPMPTSCASGRTGRTSRSGWPRCARRWAAAGPSSGWTAPS